MSMSQAEAEVGLTVLDSRAQELDRLDTIVRFTNKGLPQEVVLRLQELWDEREEIAGRVVHTGRIALAEIIRFVEANPNLAIGAALGAAVGALVVSIPILGPLAAALGFVLSSLAGLRSDEGLPPGSGPIGLAQELIALARKFFEFLLNVFNALRSTRAAV